MGSYTTTVRIRNNKNYTAEGSPNATINWSIIPKQLTIEWSISGVTDNDWVYKPSVAKYYSPNIKSGEKVDVNHEVYLNYKISYTPRNSLILQDDNKSNSDCIHAGSYTLTISWLNGTDSANYSISATQPSEL